MKIARVFPRQTRATPTDELSFFAAPPLWPIEADEVHISVVFTWDLTRAEKLAREWEKTGLPVKIGGPATGMIGEDFEPGKYLKPGYVITSRGCPNRCWFCSVWKRDGDTRELPIKDGWNILDDNLLACSDNHIKSVFAMLSRQTESAQFTGGLEAKRLKFWHADALRNLKPKQIFFANDTPDDLEPLIEAGKTMRSSGFTTESHVLRSYVLCGWPNDTFEKAERRMVETITAGFVPMAMLWRDEVGKRDPNWMAFQRTWARPAIICARKHQEARP